MNTDTDAVEHVTDIIARTSYGSIVLFADNALYFQGDDERGYKTELYKFDLGTKKRQLVKNINDSTLSSDWTAAAYFDGKALVDTGNALYVTDFTKEGSLPLGAFGPYHYVFPGQGDRYYTHAPSQMLATHAKHFISAPDLNGTTSLFITDASAGFGLKKLWDSGSKLDEIHLISALRDRLYFSLSNREGSGDTVYYAMNLTNDSVVQLTAGDPINWNCSTCQTSMAKRSEPVKKCIASAMLLCLVVRSRAGDLFLNAQAMGYSQILYNIEVATTGGFAIVRGDSKGRKDGQT